MEIVSTVLMYVVPTLIAIVFAWLKKKASNHSKALEALEAGVVNAWDTFGRDRKKKLVEEAADPNHERLDSKFEAEDRLKLKDIAKKTAIAVMSSEGLDLNKIIKSDALQDLAIKKIVDKIKK